MSELDLARAIVMNAENDAASHPEHTEQLESARRRLAYLESEAGR